MTTKTNKCIFCLVESGSFNTVEHIIPESLGNTDDILMNAVCDKCQNYLGREIEKFVLDKTPFAFWRTIYGTKSKKGKSPYCDLSLEKKAGGALADYHPFSDSGIVLRPAYSNDEAVVEAIVSDESLKKEILNGNKETFKLVLTPKSLVYMGRFLGKIALELWYKVSKDDVFHNRFNDLRSYVRYGTVVAMWPIIHCKLGENLLFFRDMANGLQERSLYKYSLYKIKSMGISLFTFDIGSERYGIILDKRELAGKEFTDEFFSAMFHGTEGHPNILFYSELR